MICIKYGPNPQGLREVHIQPQMVDRPVKKNKEIKKTPEQKKVKQMTKEKIPKAIHTPPKKEQASVENQRRSSEDQHHTTKNKQDGMEAKERAALCIHFSGMQIKAIT